MPGRGSDQRRRLKRKLFCGRMLARCCFCRRVLTFGTATIEHVIPLSAGGSWSISNLKLSCSPCNQERGDEQFEVFMSKRRRPC